MITIMVIVIACLGAIIAAYAIHEGVGIRAAMKCVGISFTFEAEKRDRRNSEDTAPTS